MGRAGVIVRAGAVIALLAGCSAGASADVPTWVPKPSFTGEGGRAQASPANPAPGPAPAPSDSNGGGNAPVPSPSNSGATDDPAIVATKLTTPDAIAVLPDNTALVGERKTGRILRVQPQPNKPVTTVRTLGGLNTAGDGGLLDLTLSPNYAEDSLIFAYITTATDNRVVAFTLNGPATSVLTGIPRGANDNKGRIAFGDDGQLYVATGDAGQPALAAATASLAGKVLRVTDVGRPSAGNPTLGSAVFTRGHHVSRGLCVIPQTNLVLQVDAAGAVNVLTAGGYYGWPNETSTAKGPLATLPASQRDPGGCAVMNNTLYVTSRQGQLLLAAPLSVRGGSVSVGKFTPLVVHLYGRLDTVVAAEDGALWIATTNKDGQGHPIPTDERIIRIIPNVDGGNSPI